MGLLVSTKKNILFNDSDINNIEYADEFLQLEDKSNMVYNEMTCYPTFFFHNPYLETDWFTETDRITISAFLNTSPENLDFKEDNIR